MHLGEAMQVAELLGLGGIKEKREAVAHAKASITDALGIATNAGICLGRIRGLNLAASLQAAVTRG